VARSWNDPVREPNTGRAVRLTHTPELVVEREMQFRRHLGIGQVPIPPDEQRVSCQRQVGWLSHRGNVYGMDEETLVRAAEPGVPYSPLYIDVEA
jgi:hypothetical protein